MTVGNFTNRIRLVYKRSSRQTKLAVCAAIILSTAALLALRSATLNAQAQADALRDQAARLEQENDKLEDKIDSLGSIDSVEQIAQEELGLVDPTTVIINPEN